MTVRSKKYQNEPIEQVDLDEINETENEAITEDNISDDEPNTEDDDVKDPIADDLKEKIKKLEQEAYDYRDRLVRKAAEFENYKKRTSDEFIRLIDTANEDLMLKLIPVVDDIERFQKNYNEDIRSEDLKKGVDMIFDKLSGVLLSSGLETITAINTDFDPDFHDALMMVEKEGVSHNKIVDVYEKGYKLKNKVIRHAKVIVSK